MSNFTSKEHSRRKVQGLRSGICGTPKNIGDCTEPSQAGQVQSDCNLCRTLQSKDVLQRLGVRRYPMFVVTSGGGSKKRSVVSGISGQQCALFWRMPMPYAACCGSLESCSLRFCCPPLPPDPTPETRHVVVQVVGRPTFLMASSLGKTASHSLSSLILEPCKPPGGPVQAEARRTAYAELNECNPLLPRLGPATLTPQPCGFGQVGKP